MAEPNPPQHQLLPCPFCGGAAELVPSRSADLPSAYVRCQNCQEKNHIQLTYWREAVPNDTVVQRWNARAALAPSRRGLPPGKLDLQKLDDAVLALLSLSIDVHQSQTPEPPAYPQLDRAALIRLHERGMLADAPGYIPERDVYLTPEGAQRAHELFRKLFCD